MSDLLLDTCAVLWLANGDTMAAEARTAIAEGSLFVSPISAWEVATLVRKNRIALTMPTTAWFNHSIARMGAELTPLSVDILIESCALPGAQAGDPADRIVIATARAAALTVVTRDAAILRYAQAGHVQALRC